jgi:hypothetical protein
LNKGAALMPIILQKKESVSALVKVLLLGIKFTSIIQHQERENLKKANPIKIILANKFKIRHL